MVYAKVKFVFKEGRPFAFLSIKKRTDKFFKMDQDNIKDNSNEVSVISNEKIKAFAEEDWLQVTDAAYSLNLHLRQLYNADAIRANFEEFRKQKISDDDLATPKDDEQGEMVNLLTAATGLVERSNHLQALSEEQELSVEDKNAEIQSIIADAKGLLFKNSFDIEKEEEKVDLESEQKSDLIRDIENAEGGSLVEKGINFLLDKSGFEKLAKENPEELRGYWQGKSEIRIGDFIEEELPMSLPEEEGFEVSDEQTLIDVSLTDERPDTGFSEFDEVVELAAEEATLNQEGMAIAKNLSAEIESNMAALNQSLDELKSNVLGI